MTIQLQKTNARFEEPSKICSDHPIKPWIDGMLIQRLAITALKKIAPDMVIRCIYRIDRYESVDRLGVSWELDILFLDKSGWSMAYCTSRPSRPSRKPTWQIEIEQIVDRPND